MTFSRVKPGGYTDDIDLLPAAELDQLDINTSQAVDGTAGGSFSPSSALQFGGSGIELLGSSNIALASRVINRRQSMAAFTSAPTVWEVTNPLIWQNLIDSSVILQMPLDRLGHGQVLDSITVRYNPNGGHGALPAILPSFTAFRVDNNGTQTSLGSITDPSGDVPTYEAIHDIALTSIAHTVDLTLNNYIITFVAEQGANYVAAAQLTSILVSMTVTGYTEY